MEKAEAYQKLLGQVADKIKLAAERCKNEPLVSLRVRKLGLLVRYMQLEHRAKQMATIGTKAPAAGIVQELNSIYAQLEQLVEEGRRLGVMMPGPRTDFKVKAAALREDFTF